MKAAPRRRSQDVGPKTQVPNLTLDAIGTCLSNTNITLCTSIVYILLVLPPSITSDKFTVTISSNAMLA